MSHVTLLSLLPSLSQEDFPSLFIFRFLVMNQSYNREMKSIIAKDTFHKVEVEGGKNGIKELPPNWNSFLLLFQLGR